MKLMYYLSTGLLSVVLLSGVSGVQAKPQIVEDLERLLPHNQIKRHVEHKKDKGRRFYNNDHRPHKDKKGHKYDRHSSHGNSKHDEGHHNGRYSKYGKHYKHDRHNGNRYYNGWGRGHERDYMNYRRQHLSAGYWGEHRRHDYRHKHHNGHNYYYDRAGFFFPGFGLIKHGHRHGRRCPDWHLEPFVAGVVLSAILNH